MKRLLVACLVAATALATSDYEAMFRDFKVSYSKSYANKQVEEKRFGVFVENVKKAESFQSLHPQVTVNVNEFADLTINEIAKLGGHKGLAAPPKNHQEASLRNKKAPVQLVDYNGNSLAAASVTVPYQQYNVQGCSSGDDPDGETNEYWTGVCQPFFLGGYSIATCSSAGIEFDVYNWEGCVGDKVTRTFDNISQCGNYGSNSFLLSCHLAPYFQIQTCSDDQCDNCGALTNIPIQSCEPFFLGGYAIATITGKEGYTLTFTAYRQSDCSDSSYSSIDYDWGTCSNYVTSQGTLAFVSIGIVATP